MSQQPELRRRLWVKTLVQMTSHQKPKARRTAGMADSQPRRRSPASPCGTAAIGRKSCRRAAAAFASELILILMFCLPFRSLFSQFRDESGIKLKQQTMNPGKLCPSLRWLVERFAKINLVNFLLKIGRDRRLSSALRRCEDAAELSE
jgi:hypothetical protein